jgi:uncharacterized protein (TIGR02117 family)
MAASRSALRCGFLICLLSACLSLSGARVFAQRSCTGADPSCKSVFIVHDSWHAAIVLKRLDIPFDAIPELVDFSQATFVEFSWGDKDYFTNPHAGVLSALKAALWSGGSVLHVVGFTGSVETFYHGAKFTELGFNAQGYDRLISYISETVSRPAPNMPAQPSAGLFLDSRFYPASRDFSLLRTCNTWVAEALEQAGLPISPRYVITAGNLQSQLSTIKLSP